MEENMQLLELLQNIEKSNRQQVKLTRLICILALSAALLCGCTLGLLWSILPQVSTIVSQLQTVLGNLEAATSQLSVIDFSAMVGDVEALVATAQQSLDQTMNKLNTIDFAALNQAIEDLSKVVEPMSRLMNVFQ